MAKHKKARCNLLRQCQAPERPMRALNMLDQVNPDLLWDDLMRYGAKSLERLADEVSGIGGVAAVLSVLLTASYVTF